MDTKDRARGFEIRRGSALVLAALCAASGVASAQQERVDFHADVELVLLHVAVIAPRGGVIPALTAEDFAVYDDGVQQRIELFLTPTDAPLDVGMVLDSSASMAPVERVARRAATTFLRSLSVDDCAYVLPFSDIMHPGRWGRSADPEMHRFIDGIRPSGGTALYDALLAGLSEIEGAASDELVARSAEGEPPPAVTSPPAEPDGAEVPVQPEEPPAAAATPPEPQPGAGPPVDLPPPKPPSLRGEAGEAIRDLELFEYETPPPVTACGAHASQPPSAANARRRALVLLSDGADEDSEATFYDALGAARAASVPVFPVALGYANEDPGSKARLAELARATGGRLIENVAPGSLADSYAEVVTLLRSYYLIGYHPSSAPGSDPAAPGGRPRWHEVNVELRRPNFEPLVRPGYYR